MPENSGQLTKKSADLSQDVGGLEQAKPVNGTDSQSGSEQKVQQTDQEIKYDMYIAMVKGMGYSLDESNDNVNVVGLRGWLRGAPVENIKNKYNDTIVCLYHEKDNATGEYVKRCTEFVASVDPGYYAADYSRGKGDANLIEGQYNYYKGYHGGSSGTYSAYNADVHHVWRDKNKDGIRQPEDNEYDETGDYDINIHAAGDASGNVGTWSAGCQVVASHDGSFGADNTSFKMFRDDIVNRLDADKKFVYTLVNGQLARDNVAQSNAQLLANFNAASSRGKSGNGEYSAGEVGVNDASASNRRLGYSLTKWKEIQAAVGFSGSDVDGQVGPATTRRIALYQEKYGLPITGICDDATYAHISGANKEVPTHAPAPVQEPAPASAPAAEPASTPASAPAATVTGGKAATINVSDALEANKSYGYSKAQWKEIQAGIGFTGDDVDGIVGKNTTRKIAEWQEANDLDVDGICGPLTYARIKERGYWNAVDRNGGQSLY